MPVPTDRQDRDPALGCVDVSARYGRITVCRDVTFEVRPGEILALLGPNGAGKSSLAGALTGLVAATGEVTVDGKRIDGLLTAARAASGIAFVPEHRGLFTSMTVQENLDLALRLAGDDGPARIHAALELFPRLAERRTQRAGSMSGGEQQMLAIARAMATGPSVLVLDEPTQGLAPRVYAMVADALTHLRDQGLSILLIEQNHAFASRFADRYVLMNSGRIVGQGDKDRLLDRESVLSAYLATGTDSRSTTTKRKEHKHHD